MDPARAPSAPAPPDCRTPCACRWRRLPATPECPPAESSSQQFNDLPQRLGADLATQAHPCTTAKRDLDNPFAIRPPRPVAIRRDLDRHHCAALDRCFRQQLPPPSEQLVAVHIMPPRHDRHRRTGHLRLCHHLALQRFGILTTLRRGRLPLSVHYAVSGYLFCFFRHPPIIAPIRAQRQGLLTEGLRYIGLSLGLWNYKNASLPRKYRWSCFLPKKYAPRRSAYFLPLFSTLS